MWGRYHSEGEGKERGRRRREEEERKKRTYDYRINNVHIDAIVV
jgi:hypothetical protein